MPSRIQTNPRGFLNLLGIRNMGQNPTVLPDTVDPTIDITQWYLLNQRLWVSNTGGGIAIPGGSQYLAVVPADALTPPANTMWYVHGAMLNLFGNTATNADVTMSLSLVSSNAAHRLTVIDPVRWNFAPAPAPLQITGQTRTPFVVNAGEELRVSQVVATVTAGAVNAQVSVLYTPILV